MIPSNPFLLIEWDPSDLDVGRIKAQIDKKKAEWNGQSLAQGPVAKRADLALSRIKEIELNLLVRPDETAFQKLVLEAKEEIVRRKRDGGPRLDNLVLVASAKGYVTPADLAQLVKAMSGIFTEAEVRSRIKVEFKEETKTSGSEDAGVKPMKSTDYKVILEDLQILEKADLFAFLSDEGTPCSRRTSSNTLHDQAGKKWAYYQSFTKKEPKVEAGSRLSGKAKIIFDPAQEDPRRSYELALENEVLKPLEEAIRLAVPNKEISAESYDALVRTGLQTGAELARVEACIRELARQKNYILYKPQHLSVEHQDACPSCHTLNADKATFCKHCGQPLAIDCPKCKSPSRVRDVACTKCGFHLGDMVLALPCVRNAHTLITEKKFAEAALQLGRADRYWPGMPDAARTRAELHALLTTQKAEVEEIQKLLDAGRIAAAEQRIRASVHPENVRHLAEKAARQRQEAQQTARDAAAELSHGRLEPALRKLQQATALGGDLTEVAALAQGMAPPAPSGALAQYSGSGIQITWPAVASPLPLTYVVSRRNLNLRETQAKVLEPKASASGHFDTSVEPGHTYEYTIATSRLGVVSSTVAATKGVTAVPDVTSLRVLPGDGLVNLQWTLPPGNASVQVTRKEHSVPASPQDGRQLAGAGAQGLTDAGLKNGTPYGYLVKVCYTTITGAQVYSTGLTQLTTPITPPEAVSHFKALFSAGKVQLTWAPITGGSPGVLLLNQPSGPRPGQMLSLADLDAIGQQVPILTPTRAEHQPGPAGTHHYLAYTRQGDTALVGPTSSVLVMEELHDCAVNVIAGEVHITWTWPDNVTRAAIGYSFTPIPRYDQAGTRVEVLREGSQRQGSYRLRPTEARNHHLRVAALMPTPSGDQATTGSAFVAYLEPPAEISFRVVKGGFFKKGRLAIRTNQAGIKTPPLQLVQNAEHVPRRSGDGEVLKEIPPVLFAAGKEHTIFLEGLSFTPGAYVSLVLADPKDAPRFRILKPDPQSLRLPAR